MASIKNQKSIIVKDVSALEQYGFVKEGNGYKFFTGNEDKYGKVYTIHIFKRGRSKDSAYKFYISSHSAQTLEVVCKLYENRIITIAEIRTFDERIRKKQLKIEKLLQEIKELEEQNETR